MFTATDPNDDLIQMPFVRHMRAGATDLCGNLRAEALAPDTNGFMADDDTALGQKILNIAQAQRKKMIGLNGTTNEAGRETVTLKTGRS